MGNPLLVAFLSKQRRYLAKPLYDFLQVFDLLRIGLLNRARQVPHNLEQQLHIITPRCKLLLQTFAMLYDSH